MKFRFIAFFLAAVFALTMISLPVWAEGEQEPSPPVNVNLFGDIHIAGDTEHVALHKVSPGETFAFTGKLLVGPIQDQIEAYKNDFAGSLSSDVVTGAMKAIKLSGVTSTFTVTLTLGEGLEFTDPSHALADFTSNNLFAMTSITPGVDNKHDVVAKMTLTKAYDNFYDLYMAVTGCPDLELTVPGVRVDPTVAPGTTIQTTGAVTGTFHADSATFGSTQDGPYDFMWQAVQLPLGQDHALKGKDDQTISYTVLVDSAPPAPAVPEEEQDILIPCPYPCQVPPMWNPQPQPSQMIQQVQPMPQAPVQNVDAAQAPIQLPKTGEKRPQPLSLFFLLSASALFLLRRKMR